MLQQSSTTTVNYLTASAIDVTPNFLRCPPAAAAAAFRLCILGLQGAIQIIIIIIIIIIIPSTASRCLPPVFICR